MRREGRRAGIGRGPWGPRPDRCSAGGSLEYAKHVDPGAFPNNLLPPPRVRWEGRGAGGGVVRGRWRVLRQSPSFPTHLGTPPSPRGVPSYYRTPHPEGRGSPTTPTVASLQRPKRNRGWENQRNPPMRSWPTKIKAFDKK